MRVQLIICHLLCYAVLCPICLSQIVLMCYPVDLNLLLLILLQPILLLYCRVPSSILFHHDTFVISCIYAILFYQAPDSCADSLFNFYIVTYLLSACVWVFLLQVISFSYRFLSFISYLSAVTQRMQHGLCLFSNAVYSIHRYIFCDVGSRDLCGLEPGVVGVLRPRRVLSFSS